jgi:hypothetical protein
MRFSKIKQPSTLFAIGQENACFRGATLKALFVKNSLNRNMAKQKICMRVVCSKAKLKF